MAVLPLLYFGNPLLRKRSREVPDPREVQPLILDMLETMYHYKGVGLAAVQVNRPVRLFVMNAEQDPDKGVRGREEVFINPRILRLYGRSEEYEEGCLCVPDVREKVKRKTLLDIEYLDRNGEPKSEKGVKGMRARVMQHEYDHLDGMLFVDRLSIAKKLVLRRELNLIAKEHA